MASFAPSLTSMSLSDSSLFTSTKPSTLFRLKPSFYTLGQFPLSISLQKNNTTTTFHLTPFVAQTSGWTQQEVEDKQTAESGSEDVEEDIGGVTEEETTEEQYVEPPEEAKLFVGGIPFDVSTDQLAELFNQAGIVEIAEIIYNRETDQSRGFGFVTMSTVEEADKAIEMFDRYELNGRLLKVNRAAPRGTRVERVERQPRVPRSQYSIYVGNLAWSVDEARLEQLFSEFGKVVSTRVMYDRESGRSRGFGFVAMETQEDMNDAIAALDGKDMEGRALRVNVAEDRRSQNTTF